MRESLAEIRVIETAQHVAGPYCGKLLADHGADVVKVEPPGGDSARGRGPFPGDAPDADRSGLFLHLNTNKKSVVLDLRTDAGRRLLGGLVSGARLLIDDGTLAASGVDVGALLAANRALVVVQVTGYGDGGPYGEYRANDYAIYASSAWMCAMGDPDKPPLYPGRDYPFYICGLYAAFGALVALRHARRTGEGQRVTVSALDASISFDFYETTKFSYRGKLRRRDSHMITGVAASTQPCQDGYVALTFAGEDDWQRFCEVIEAPELRAGRLRDRDAAAGQHGRAHPAGPGGAQRQDPGVRGPRVPGAARRRLAGRDDGGHPALRAAAGAGLVRRGRRADADGAAVPPAASRVAHRRARPGARCRPGTGGGAGVSERQRREATCTRSRAPWHHRAKRATA